MKAPVGTGTFNIFKSLVESSSINTTTDLQLYFRLYSDEEYLVRAASRLGLGQELLDGDMVDNLSRGLQTAAGAYKFLSELH